MMRYQLLGIMLFSLVFTNPSLAAESITLPKGILELKPSPAPRTTLEDLDGETYTLKQDKGAWIFVHFWASWCGPCREEMPEIQNMISTLQAEGLKVAMINTAEDEDTVFSFLSAYAPDIRPLMDRDGQVTEKWRPRGLPATYLVDPDGQVLYQALGGRAWDTTLYMSFLRGLLKTK